MELDLLAKNLQNICGNKLYSGSSENCNLNRSYTVIPRIGQGSGRKRADHDGRLRRIMRSFTKSEVRKPATRYSDIEAVVESC